MKLLFLPKLLAAIAIAIGVALVGCNEAPLPDPHYLQIKGAKLAIPKKYAEAGSGLNVPSNHDSIRQMAATPPGMEIVEFLMRLEFKGLQPQTYDSKAKGIPDDLDVWILIPTIDGQNRGAEFRMQRSLRGERRRPEKDQFGLNAFADDFESPHSDWYYYATYKTVPPYMLECRGFGFDNPLCKTTFTWQGLMVRYQFRHIHLAQWQSTHDRVLALLESFRYAR